MYNIGEISDINDTNLPPWERGVRQGGNMNLDVVKQNALDFKEIVESNGISFSIMFGTLLGAIREGNVISHDSDFDVFCFRRDYLKWPKAKKDLIANGFIIPEIQSLLDEFLIRDGEKIDINWVIPFKQFYVYDETIYYPKSYFDSLEHIILFGVEFSCPRNAKQLVIDLYGETWNIPSHSKGRRSIY